MTTKTVYSRTALSRATGRSRYFETRLSTERARSGPIANLRIARTSHAD